MVAREILNVLPLRSGIRVFTLPLLFYAVLEVLASAVKQEKEIKLHLIYKGRSKMTVIHRQYDQLGVCRKFDGANNKSYWN